MNPYQELDVPMDATDETIKQAFKRKAQECHPDKGGDAAQFAVINAAYRTLRDPEKRRRYHEFGAIDNEASPESFIRSQALEVLVNIVDMIDDIDHVNVIEVAKSKLDEAIAHGENLRDKELPERIKKAMRVRNRMKSKRKDDPLFEMYEFTIEKLEAERKLLFVKIDNLRKVRAFFDEWEYKVDPVAKHPMMVKRMLIARETTFGKVPGK